MPNTLWTPTVAGDAPHGRQPVAPSAIRPAGIMFTAHSPHSPSPTCPPAHLPIVQAGVDELLDTSGPAAFYGGGEAGHTDHPAHTA